MKYFSQTKSGRNYTFVEWLDDFKNLIRKSGIYKKKIMFLCDATTFPEPICFDYIVRWIAGYEIADLFNTEEKLEILEIYQRIASESVGFVFFTTNNSHYIRYALHFVNALF